MYTHSYLNPDHPRIKCPHGDVRIAPHLAVPVQACCVVKTSGIIARRAAPWGTACKRRVPEHEHSPRVVPAEIQHDLANQADLYIL
jgi:hypothetical protein